MVCFVFELVCWLMVFLYLGQALAYFELFIILVAMLVGLVPALWFVWLLGCFVALFLCTDRVAYILSFSMIGLVDWWVPVP